MSIHIPAKNGIHFQKIVSVRIPYASNDPRREIINNTLVTMVCVDSAPTNIVQRPGFVNLMKTLDPKYTLPYPSTIARSYFAKAEKRSGFSSQEKNRSALEK